MFDVKREVSGKLVVESYRASSKRYCMRFYFLQMPVVGRGVWQLLWLQKE
jgi:hypothetical protein